jgi:hypothetical protein
MKRTPAIEASLVYGISLVLTFILFLLSFGLTKAVTLSQWVAILLLMPAWVLLAAVSYFQKKATKFGRFFAHITVIAVITLIAIILVANLPAAVQSQPNVIGSLNLAIANFFISTVIADAFTLFWIYRKSESKPSYAPVNPSLVRSPKKKKK